MNTLAGDPADPLVMLQLQVARRADELAAGINGGAISLNLPCWLKAEEEVFACALGVSISLDRTAGPGSPPDQ